MTDKVIDQKALLLSPPEFMIAPSYNGVLQGIADRRNEAYDEIARLFETVWSFHGFNCSIKIAILTLISSASTMLALDTVSVLSRVIITKWIRFLASLYFKFWRTASISQLMAKSMISVTWLFCSDLRTPSEEYEHCRNEYNQAQKGLVDSIIAVAATYLPLFHIYSSLIAQLDVLLSFAEVSSNSVIPYTRPTLLDVTKQNRMHLQSFSP